MSGLVGWWPLAEWSGRANDLSGEGNHGTVNGATQGVWGRGGLTAYSFDGDDDFVQAPQDSLGVHGGDTVTVSAWVNWDGTTDTIQGIFQSLEVSGVAGVSNPPVVVQIAGGSFQAGIQDSTNSFNGVTDPDALNSNTWIHVCLTYDGQNILLYKDAEIADSNSVSVTINGDATEQPEMGRQNDPDNRYFDGNIADVRFYNRALSESEVQTLYNWGSEDYTTPSLSDGTDTGAVSRYEFEGNVQDSWGTNDGTDNTSAGFSSDGIQGQAKSFDGTDDNISFGGSVIDSANSHSFSVWIFAEGTSRQRIINTNDNSNGVRVYWNETETNGDVTYQIEDSGTLYSATTGSNSLSTNSWYHAVGVFDGSSMTLYINGVEEDNETGASSGGDPLNMAIGYNNASNTEYFNGEIDDVRIYDRALSQPEAFELYQWGARGRDMRPMLVKQ